MPLWSLAGVRYGRQLVLDEFLVPAPVSRDK